MSSAHASTLPVTSGLILHLDANDPLDNGGSLPADNTAISSWEDTSASNFDATQGTVAQQPIFKLNAINGLPAMRFDGLGAGQGDYLSLGTQLGKQPTFTAIVVLVNANAAVDSSPLGSGNASGMNVTTWLTYANFPSETGQQGDLYYSFGDGANYSDGSTNNVVMPNNTIAILAQTYTTGDNFIRVYSDGVQQATSIETASAATSISSTAFEMSVGRFGAYGGGFYFPGDIAQVIIYDRVLTTQERDDVSAYLHALYIPEPASLAMLAGGAMALVRRRARARR